MPVSPPRMRFTATISGIFILVLIIGLFTTSHESATVSFSKGPSKTSNPQFHLLLPATSSNVNLCRLLLSAAITGYPNPIFLGWEGHGQYNGSESHLFKISETLAYLGSLPPSADNDLVLVLDAYDIWLQLRPDVVIKRYHTAIEKANNRLKSEGIHSIDHGGAIIKQSILFGPDKTCWPDDERRAACWAIPESSLASDMFGPATDTWMVPNRPRWLNSGTIMGPAQDMRAMFAATMGVVRRKYDEGFEFRNSDQYYFQEMWAEQEVGRSMRRDGKVEAPLVKPDVRGTIPKIPRGIRTEHHVALDYESDVFQTSAAYTEYLTWMSFNHSTPLVNQVSGTTKRIDQMVLSGDIESSIPPFGADKPNTTLPTGKGWADMMLGTNMVTQQIFPVWHMTGEKSYRTRWWPRMWFHPHAEALLDASKREAAQWKKGERAIAKAKGISYTGAEMQVREKPSGTDVGVWTDQGNFVPWDSMCGTYSEELFL
jgi:hypothetical protein